MQPVRLAVIGAGVIGRRHIQIASASHACQLVAVCDSDPERRAVADEFGAPFYQDYREMLAREAPQGVIIATPTPQHAAVGIACAESSVNLLIEKPITATVEEGRRLLEVADRQGVQILVGHHRRHNPLVQRARTVIQNGELGKLVAVSVMWATLKPEAYYQVDWRTQPPGGGPVLINLIHDIDNLRYICGEIRSVYAVTSSAVRPFAVEDSAGVTLQFESGALGSLVVSDAAPSPWSYELTSGENPGFLQNNENSYYFLGTTASLAFPRMEIWRYPDAREAGWQSPLVKNRLDIEHADPLTAQLTHFCRVISGEDTPIISGQDALKTLASTLAVLESSRNKAPVTPAV